MVFQFALKYFKIGADFQMALNFILKVYEYTATLCTTLTWLLHTGTNHWSPHHGGGPQTTFMFTQSIDMCIGSQRLCHSVRVIYHFSNHDNTFVP